MRCPYCQEGDSRVIDTREVGNTIRRRRECPRCGQRFTTYERLSPVSLLVVKRDGRREPFDREKLYLGIYKACAKRPISEEQIEKLVGHIESELFALGKAEVESKVIGEMVMEQLRDLDDVAYVRFASVYRRFKDVNGLVEEIKEFKKWKQRGEPVAAAAKKGKRTKRS
ncbi:MAG: transcriptional repressor NrdR [Chloroflexi bacterium]|nr:transcriptional repressor NrdR [Chloroflexota bacterium]